ncbi:MAG: DUF4231 domain-containing protein [Chitinophagia bacterium]|nr:DUF4231 domain-containing protein [Chitinophagia bacterium]
MTDFNQLPRTEAEYLQDRVLDQINWFDLKSSLNKKWFLRLKITEIIVSLFIPFLAANIPDGQNPVKYIVGILGIVVAAIAGVITLVKFQENWIEYRNVSEVLKLEKFLFLSKAGIYKDNPNAFQAFVERFETHIATSNQKWVEYNNKKEGAAAAQETPKDNS